jgi:cytochrome c553
MMNEATVWSWRNPWLRRSVVSLAVFVVVSVGVGFVWLPSAASDFGSQGLWASICRAAGVPTAWGGDESRNIAGAKTTSVVLERSMAATGTADSVGRGATLALSCTMCHGAQGASVSDAPNLAGQYPEVVIKQLHDFQGGQRPSAIMQALARGLSDKDIADLAAYYAWLPKARNTPTTYADALPALVRVGSPMRNVAPCISCHGSVDQKLGAPWLEGMPKAYLVAQLANFQSGVRRNDSHAQMRNMARTLSAQEMSDVADFYARRGLPGAAR